MTNNGSGTTQSPSLSHDTPDKDVVSVISQYSRESALIFQQTPLDESERRIIKILNALHLALARIVAILVLRRNKRQRQVNTSDSYDGVENGNESFKLLETEFHYGGEGGFDTISSVASSSVGMGGPVAAGATATTPTSQRRRSKNRVSRSSSSSSSKKSESIDLFATADPANFPFFDRCDDAGFPHAKKQAQPESAHTHHHQQQQQDEKLLTFFEENDVNQIFNQESHDTTAGKDWFDGLKMAAAGEESIEVDTDDFFSRLLQDDSATEEAVQNIFAANKYRSKASPLGSVAEGNQGISWEG